MGWGEGRRKESPFWQPLGKFQELKKEKSSSFGGLLGREPHKYSTLRILLHSNPCMRQMGMAAGPTGVLICVCFILVFHLLKNQQE